jgi:glycosyltransferase involved in cell wall biosynthesis
LPESGQAGGSAKVRVILPMMNLVPGGMGGTETYAAELMAVLRRDPLLALRAMVPASAEGYIKDVDTTVVRGVSVGASSRERLLGIGRAAISSRARRELAWGDVVHYPFTVPAPATRRRPRVITLHDVQHLVMPEFFSAGERAYRRIAYDRAARRADIVITDSNYSRDQIVTHLGIPADRVRAIHLGVSGDFVPARGDREAFVLYPARRWPHKNHERLLTAMARVRERHPSLRLVLTGGGEPLAATPEWVDQLGMVSRAELLSLYRRASVVAYPSLYEGFGLPPLEAMASGCPVAVSRAGALPEVCGDTAALFDPLDVGAIAAGIEQALTLGEVAVERGIARAAEFTWDRCAEAHRDVYFELAGR